jgi:ATP diphosphatase
MSQAENPTAAATSHGSSDACSTLQRLLDIVSALRDPATGCPWDLKQTTDTLKPLVLNEAYEVVDTAAHDDRALAEELGDLLALLALFSQIASERGGFTFASITTGVADKLVRRHPHVFGDTQVRDTAEVLKNWEAIKKQERQAAAAQSGSDAQQRTGLLDNIPRALPALQRAQVIGERCATVGFDWHSAHAVAEKVREELSEFLAELPTSGTATNERARERSRAEFGDLLFSLVQYGRHLGINAEQALSNTIATFNQRFGCVERLAAEHPGSPALDSLTSEQLEQLWEEAKRLTNGGSQGSR